MYLPWIQWGYHSPKKWSGATMLCLMMQSCRKLWMPQNSRKSLTFRNNSQSLTQKWHLGKIENRLKPTNNQVPNQMMDRKLQTLKVKSSNNLTMLTCLLNSSKCPKQWYTPSLHQVFLADKGELLTVKDSRTCEPSNKRSLMSERRLKNSTQTTIGILWNCLRAGSPYLIGGYIR